MIRNHETRHSVVLMCRVLAVSRAGYYEWRNRKPSARELANAELATDVRRVYDEHKGRAGSPRITKQLREEGQTVGENRVARVMQAESLRAKAARKYKATTNSSHSLPVAPNLLEQDFTAVAPNRKWVSDITYVATDEGWLYLAVVLDLYSRLVVGWARRAHDGESCMRGADDGALATENAKWRHRPLRPRQPVLFGRLSAPAQGP